MSARRKQEVLKSDLAQSRDRRTGSAGKSGKAAGTRVGGMVDWRTGGGKGAAEKSGLGKSVRDGR
ncbi:MAG TPA: hypothetical protein VJV03_19815 [Pyrinomonadaceae bacterium]|nr:hypothetical protein [Pyrinomonadaceae bacterium]